jgi:hypothetical protein
MSNWLPIWDAGTSASRSHPSLRTRMVIRGELPLLDVLAVLPREIIVGLEVPMRGRAEAGIGPHERLSGCVNATRGLLKRLDG